MGVVIASMLGVCAIGLETCMWMADHMRHERDKEALYDSNSELKRTVMSLVEDKRDLARKLDEAKAANQDMRKALDDARRMLAAKEGYR